MDIDLTKVFLESFKKKRILGRYNVSEIWGINNGYTAPQEYLSPKPTSLLEALRMKEGTLKHLLVGECLERIGWEIEKKIEYPYKDIIIIGKADGIKDDMVVEIKTSDKIIAQAKRWHIDQLKFYLSMFQKPTGIVFQPIKTADKLFLKEIGQVKRGDMWFKNQLEKLYQFHQKLLN